jgi:hypothetical protein
MPLLCDLPNVGSEMSSQLKDRGCDNALPDRAIAHLKGHRLMSMDQWWNDD